MFSRSSSGLCRRASHAGSWYSGNRSELQGQLDGWLKQANDEGFNNSKEKVFGVVGPHAGYFYSGETAAYAYAHLASPDVKRVFVLGPSHAWYVPSCALSEASEFETPIGNLKVDQEVMGELRATKQFEKFELRRDEKEHSLEMHMPYIARVMQGRDFTIVPILVGSVNHAQEEQFGKLLAPYLSDPANAFVISSDFCHWGHRFDYRPSKRGEPIHQTISNMDHEGMRLIEALDTDGFAEYLGRTNNTICGRHPIAVYMHALNASKMPWQVKFVRYAQSSKVTDANDSSVSYASAVVTLKQQ